MAFLVAAQLGGAWAQTAFVYGDMCDASAAVALDRDHFVVADDGLNILRIYRRDLPQPIADVTLWKFLGTKKDKESDIEGAAQIGASIYWISSHGRTSDAKFQKRRHRFFATEIKRIFGEPRTIRLVSTTMI